MDPKPGRRVPSAHNCPDAGVFSYTEAIPDGLIPAGSSIAVNDPRFDGLATLYGLLFRCPACARLHSIALDRPEHALKGSVKWTWNGDMDKPTCTPSIRAIRHGDRPQCGFHGYITDGVWTFCDDSACDPRVPDGGFWDD